MEKQKRFIGWGITEKCNLTCPHCYSAATKTAPSELSTDECRKIVEQLARADVEYIGWTGGEPLLRKDLEELITCAGKAGIKSSITTNGVLLTQKRADAIREAGVEAIQISLDGSTVERNKAMRLATAKQFESVIKSIGFCHDNSISVHMAMLLGQENLDDARNFVQLAESLGVSSVRFCAYVPWGGGKSPNVQKRLGFTERLCDLKHIVEDLQDNDSTTVMFDPGFGPLPSDYFFHKCISGVQTFYVGSTGDVYPCTALLDDQFKVGNLRKRTIQQLLDDPKMTRISDYDRSQIDGHCSDCRHHSVCRGACRGITYAHTGDLDASFPTCLSRVE